MKTQFLFVLFFISLFSVLASAQEHNTLLPGEPDPNTSPQTDAGVTNTLIDDRSPCPVGSKKYQKFICADEETIPKCEKAYHPLLECRKGSGKLNCKPPRKAVHLFVCDKVEKKN